MGVERGIIDLGGNIALIGAKSESSGWTVGIKEPFSTSGELAGYVEVSDMSVVTSGIYERAAESGGRLWHHLINPNTGMPEDNEFASVTIISESSAECDALSTICYLMGEDGMTFAEEQGVEAVFITRDGSVLHTGGIGSSIPFTEN